MLIAFVSPSGWTVYNFRLDVIRALQNDGHQVLVVAGRDAFAEKLEAAGCRFIGLPFNNRSTRPWNDWRLYRRLKAIYRAEQPALVFHYAIKANIWGSVAAARCGIPGVAVVTGLGYPFSRRNLLYYIAKAGYAKACRQARRVWFLNQADAALFRSLQLAEESKIQVLPGEGINTGYFSRSIPYEGGHEIFRFVLCSRLLKSKGIALYARAIAALRQKGYAVEGWLLGLPDAGHPDELPMTEIDRWHREGAIRYQGAAGDVRPWLEQADAYAFTSHYNEGLPRSLMEAASMELPVLAPDLRGCRDLVKDGETGFVFRAHDPQQLLEKMEALLCLPADQRRAMGAAGRAFMQAQFETSRVISIYRDTVAALSC